MKALTACVFFVAFAVFNCWSCDPRPHACPRNYDPVCATFTKTFANQCELESNLCRLATEGFQYTESSRPGDCCKKACTLEYKPVCATNGKIYSNKCLLEAARCAENDWFVPTKMEECRSS